MTHDLDAILALLPKPQDADAWRQRIADFTRPITEPPKQETQE